MATTVEVRLDKAAHGLLLWLLEAVRQPGCRVYGLELELLILLEFQRKHLGRLMLAKPPYMMQVRPHQALSFRRVLFGIDMPNELADITRNAVCESIRQQIPHLC